MTVLLGLTAVAGAEQRYVVEPGDTLYALARRFGTSVADLESTNNLNGDRLVPGQVLRVPGGDGGGYRVTFAAPGETLPEVAARVGRSVATLDSANPLLATGGLRPGAPVSVPPAEGTTVIASAGETLASLAARVGVSEATLAKANGLVVGATLSAGMPLLVPAAGGAAAASATGVAAAIIDPRARLAAMQTGALQAAVSRLPRVRLSVDTFIAPVHGRVSSGFGWRTLSVNGNHFHAGVDLAVPMGTPVHAARDGTVVLARWDGTYGNVVFLDHGDGSQTRYAHMSRIAVTLGEQVRQGDVLGYAGSTGASTGPHVHFELRFDGRAVDPLQYLRGSVAP